MPCLLYFCLSYVAFSLRTHCVCRHWKCREGCHCLSPVTNYRYKMDRWHSNLSATADGNRTAGTTSYWQLNIDRNLAAGTVSYCQLSMETGQLAPLPIGKYRWGSDSWYHFLLATNCRCEPDSWHHFLLATIDGDLTACTTSYWQLSMGI